MSRTIPRAYHLRYIIAHLADHFNMVVYAPDGKALASGSADGTVRLWESQSGKPLKALNGHQDGVSSVAWSPDGKLLASGSADGTVRLWDAESGKLLIVLHCHPDGVSSVAWSPDGQMLASGSNDRMVRLWEAQSGRLLKTLEGYAGRVRSVAWSPDGNALASGSDDQMVRLWEPRTGKLQKVLEGHADRVRSVAWSPNGRVLVSGSDDKTVRLWEAQTGRPLKILEGHAGRVRSVAWSPNGKVLVSGSDDQMVRLWEAQSGKLLKILEGHANLVRSVAWSPDGKVLTSSSDDNTARLWEAHSGKLLQTLEGHSNWARRVVWSPDGKVLACVSYDGSIRLWEAQSGELLKRLNYEKSSSVAWSLDGRLMASGSDDGAVRVWDVQSGRLLKTMEGPAEWVSSVAWSLDGKILASGSNDGTVRLWMAQSGQLLETMKANTNLVTSVAWSPDGNALASGFADGTVRLWEAQSGKLLKTMVGDVNGVMTIEWSPDGKVLASGSTDGVVRLWEAQGGSLLKTLEGHADWVRSVAWSPDGKLLASGSNDGTVRIWDPQRGSCQEVHDLNNSGYYFVDAVFVPLGRVAASFGTTVLGDVDLIAGTIVPGAFAPTPLESSSCTVSAKIVLMGECGVGKSGLALRLAEERFEPQVSTHGMRLWPLPYEKLDNKTSVPAGEQRDIVLWDLGGQAEYRLVHQLFLHDTTLALMLLDPTRDSHFHDVDQWNLRLQKQLRGQKVSKLLVGTQADLLDPHLIDSVRIEETIEKWQMQGFHLTSAKANTGIDELRTQLAKLIEWDELSRTTRPRLWQRIRDMIDEMRREGRIVVLYSALEKELRALLGDEYDGEAVHTVVGQLARQGAITDTRLATGERALLLQIGYVEIYAGSLIRLAREAAHASGVPALEVIDAIIRKSYPGISDGDRLADPLTERSVLECVIELLIEHGICLKHEGLLVFPVLFPEATSSGGELAQHTVSLYYDFSGAIDNIYSALVAQLAVSTRFGRVRLWRDRAEFERTGQGVCALRRLDRPGGWSHVDLLFSEQTSSETRDLFTAVVEQHLQKEGVALREVLEMECPKCTYRFDEPLLRKRIEGGKTDAICPDCETRSPINPGAKKNDPQVAYALIGLRKTIEDRKHRDIEAAKRELAAARVFISYADRDEDLCRLLQAHLSVLQRQGHIQMWYNQQVPAGASWEDEIDRNLSRASVVLLLISADYVTSDYCFQTEMKHALARHAAGQARVIPILVRPVDGWQKMPFGQLQALPVNGKPISLWANLDEALADVAAGIKRAVEELMRPSQATEPRVLVTDSPSLKVIEPTPIRILHLSDLHLGKDDDPHVQLQPLLRDLRDSEGGLSFGKLDYLVISGDLTQRATPEEFECSYQFISRLIQELELSAARVVITPGNHDLSWEPEVYQWRQKRKVDLSKLKSGSYVAQGDGYLVRDDASYSKRWDNFGRFYHQLTQHPYSAKPEGHCRAMLFDELRVQFLEINSAWEIDEYFHDRSGIHPSALANGLMQANAQLTKARADGRIAKDASVFRIAVWHHPGTGNEKIKNDAFIDQLRQEGFKLCLHGHVHEDRADVVRYFHPRKLYVAGAGSFGAPMRDRPESTPRLYNVLELARDHSKVAVHTRCLRKEGGAWEGWAMWPDEDATKRRTFYEIRF